MPPALCSFPNAIAKLERRNTRVAWSFKNAQNLKLYTLIPSVNVQSSNPRPRHWTAILI